MSDPLSVAGSAVGIISLGIQVCQGLISYLQSFKGQDQDIQDSLNDVQTVISILCSLKGILPKVDKSSSETPAIRRCLAESEEKLREFQQFSLKLRGTKSPEHDVVGKMDHARHALLYPFREGKLKSLCRALKGLLQNLSLCLDITTLDIAVGIHTNVDDLGNAFKDQGANVAKLSDQLQRLESSMSAYYQDLKSEISQAQLFAQDLRQEIDGQLRLISTDIGSLMSINRRHQEDVNQCLINAFDELKEQNNFQNELIRTTLVGHNTEAFYDNTDRILLKGMDGMSIQNTGSRQVTALARTGGLNQLAINPPGCACERQGKYSVFAYQFWHATFEYKEETPGSVTANEISLRFSEAERAILSLYRDRESSPYDQDEEGKSHALLALETTLGAGRLLQRNTSRSTVKLFSLSAKRLIEKLVSTAGDENGEIEHIFELHPIMQAIFQESTSMFEIALSMSPEAVTERICSATTVELCVYWPEGLRKLLRTKAVDVLDERALRLAVDTDCIESVDLLLKAGCPINYENQTEALQDTASSGSHMTGGCIEVVRFLTFEALEMTHTCCDFTVIDRPDISREKFHVLMNCDPERWQKIRSDKREQENAALLETLMEEFIAYMIGMESSPRSLEIFVNSFWRQRISEIYAVNLDDVKVMKNYLVDTKTYVLPDRVRDLLGEDFKLIELQDLKSEPTPVGGTGHDRKVDLGDESFELLPCKWCS
ncbi:hypothetical protein FPHYL_10971 [Fusarium phyllophilum]|uniref:Azaphilone pigments biosynthesis cluster protein L N-terminal domain-containing protein n=1 Tax=Fusarium phyllophilum TaxID=47803 RepID=A0A8H5IXE8_9HYPO|nr:hypothetical protein FPHYL_10971 [Fusarium phyllophilum]